jgi:CheY-like chemotaxis protein
MMPRMGGVEQVQPVPLVVSDVMMPRMAGVERVRRLRTAPRLPIETCAHPSDFDDDTSPRYARLLAKPFTSDQRVRAAQEALDASRAEH